MNQSQRKQIQAVVTSLEGATVGTVEGVLAAAKETIESIRDEEQEKYDNMPESLQGSERGETMEEGIGYLDSAVSALEEAISAVEDTVKEAEDEPKEEGDDTTDDVIPDEAQSKIDEAIEELGNVG